jgi:chitinase
MHPMTPFWKMLHLLLVYLACSPIVTAGHARHRRHGHRRHNHTSKPWRRNHEIIAARNPGDAADPPLRPSSDTPPGTLTDLISHVESEVTISRIFLDRLQADIAALQDAVMALLANPTSPSNPLSTATAAKVTSTLASTATPTATSTGNYEFDPGASDNLAVYYAQTPVTNQVPLDALCQNSSVDIIILAFLNNYFAGGDYPSVNFGAACGGQTDIMTQKGTDLLYCADLMERIKTCQSIGKKVFLSLGGSISTSNFTSDDQAIRFAKAVWDLFGAGDGEDPGLRPFGDVILDGFDIGILASPSNHNPTPPQPTNSNMYPDNEDHSTAHYDVFMSALRSHFSTFDPSTLTSEPLTYSNAPRRFYISAAPQCPRPDASIPLSSMQSADFVWVQFYNNPACNIGTPGFENSFRAWSQDLAGGRNEGPKLYLGAPSFADGGQGYMDAGDFSKVIEQVKVMGISNFGGVMLWDGSEGVVNVVGGESFIDGITEALKG